MRKINTKQLTQIKSVIKNGKKQFYFWYYCPDLQKDRLRKFSDTEAEAKVLREQIKEKQVLGPSAPITGNISLGEVCGQWIADRESAMNGNRITEGTYEWYKYLVEAWSPLYQIPIKDLSYKDVQSHLDNMDRSQGTRIHHFERLKQVISFAVDEGYLFKQHETMIDRARPPRGEETEIQIPSEESVAKLIGACSGFWKATVLIFVSTGIRFGEYAALPWKNVHFNNKRGSNRRDGYIRITQARQKKGKIGPPKGKKNREVPISEELADLLMELPREGEFVFPLPEFNAFATRNNQWGHKQNSLPRLRGSEEHKMMTDQQCWSQLGNIIRDNHIDWPQRIHCMRHFAVSRMIDAGWNVKLIQTRIGHKSATLTLNRYGHLMERSSFEDEAQDMVRGLI